jgi:hypothetical protein
MGLGEHRERESFRFRKRRNNTGDRTEKRRKLEKQNFNWLVAEDPNDDFVAQQSDDDRLDSDQIEKISSFIQNNSFPK